MLKVEIDHLYLFFCFFVCIHYTFYTLLAKIPAFSACHTTASLAYIPFMELIDFSKISKYDILLSL